MCLLIRKTIKKKSSETDKAYLARLIKKYQKRAKKDITVYKVVQYKKGKYITPYRSFILERNTHYYQTGQKFTYGVLDTFFKIYRGLHCYNNEERANSYCYLPERKVIKATIPKGSLYFKSGIQIASDNLIIH